MPGFSAETSWFEKSTWQTNMAAALLSGLVVVVFINPLDVVATRLYNQPAQQRFGKLQNNTFPQLK
jgi:hypothetical protein